MATIGLKNLYYATITDGATGETYGTPVSLAKAVSADMSVETEEAILYCDDGADEVIRDFKKGSLSLNVSEIGSAKAAALLGARVDAKGALISNAEDEAPYVAIGFEAKNAAGGSRLMWLYRCKFSVPNESFKTKGESVEFTTPTITGTFVRRNKVDTVGSNKHPWKAEINSGEAGADATTVAGWFSTVYEPGAAPSP